MYLHPDVYEVRFDSKKATSFFVYLVQTTGSNYKTKDKGTVPFQRQCE